MGFGDPDHHHPLNPHRLEKEVSCFRCELIIIVDELCYGCTRCNHFIHLFCFDLPQNMKHHPLHPQHSLTLLPSPSSQIPENCSQCLQPFLGGYAYHCQDCLEYNLHLKCFLTLNLETKHQHPLSLCEAYSHFQSCGICGLMIEEADVYAFACRNCRFIIHYDCTFIPPTVKHHHVHELSFEYNFPERSKMVDCDICYDKDDKELDRTLSYYYCENCDYITHVRCVTSCPPIVTIQFDHFTHEHPMIFVRFRSNFECVACKCSGKFESFYFCKICNYTIHNSCARFPRSIKHPHHKKSHTLVLQNKPSQLDSCELCTKKDRGKGWIFQCSDCEYAIHLSCSLKFEHPLYKGGSLSISSYDDTKFRCNACGELGDGFGMSRREFSEDNAMKFYDLHLECFALPGQIKHGCHSHPLYLVFSPTEVESYSSTIFQCDICHIEADPDLWVYCCIECKYIAHLNCVISDLLPVLGRSYDLSNLYSIAMCEKEKFKVNIEQLVDCVKFSRIGDYRPVFIRSFEDLRSHVGDHTSDVIDLEKSSTDLVHCPKCEKSISAQAYFRVYDWVYGDLKGDIYSYENENPTDYESLALLDEKVAEELYCPVCNMLIFSPTYSCAECQIYFHKSCAELPRKYTFEAGHTLVLQSTLPINCGSLINCGKCKDPIKGYAYSCVTCGIAYDVTCALGAPLLKQKNQKHCLYVTSNKYYFTWRSCIACRHQFTKESSVFKCGSDHCNLELHAECAMLPSMVKVERRIHHHPLVLEPNLDLTVDDYICDVCEKELNPCIWVYRCSDSCGDRATFHVSCIVTSNKKKCHFIYDEECSYPHVDHPDKYNSLKKQLAVPALAAALENKPPREQYSLLYDNLFLFVDELEHFYTGKVTRELMKKDQALVLHLMESPDAMRANVAETMKYLPSLPPGTNDENIEEEIDYDEDIEEEIDYDEDIEKEIDIGTDD